MKGTVVSIVGVDDVSRDVEGCGAGGSLEVEEGDVVVIILPLETRQGVLI